MVTGHLRGFLEYWPSATDPEAERINALPKYVVSTTLKHDGAPARHGGTGRSRRLRYRWRITRAPRGSRATLRTARSRRPVLVSDRRGTYRLSLSVRDRGRRVARDGVRVAAVPPDAPIGVKVDTIPGKFPDRSNYKGITIDGKEYDPASGDVQGLFLARETREVIKTASYSYKDDRLWGQLKTDLNDKGSLTSAFVLATSR